MELIIYIKMDLALNNLQQLICHKTQPNQTKPKTLPHNAESPEYYIKLDLVVRL